MMIKQTYQLQLASPAFLGGADQRGTWRTPPLKSLIREWWRVAIAAAETYEHRNIKRREIRLFGTAADEAGGENQRSQIRLALKHWDDGKCTSWPDGERRVTHPEVKNKAKEPMKVGSELYLGYGPLVFQQGTKLKKGAALQAGETNILRLALPDAELADITRAITLAHWFGTIGGRSRNGWGSLRLTAAEGTLALTPLTAAALSTTGCTRRLADCLALDWPHAIGSDGKGVLVWQSKETFADWREAMRFLAETKIAFRHDLKFVGGEPHREPQSRHVLAYPVTHHKVPAWEGQGRGRLANTLRFKLQLDAGGGLRALIYHTPCRPTLPHGGVDLLDT